jgi:hypothetical protein
MDTVTLVRSAIRGLLRACDGELAVQLRRALARDDDYVTAGKPACDYDDPAAREELVDAALNHDRPGGGAPPSQMRSLASES